MGFVSNSSSSSFIIGIAAIKNYDEFYKWYLKNKDDHKYEIYIVAYNNAEKIIYTSDDISEKGFGEMRPINDYLSSFRTNDKYIEMENFATSVLIEYDPNDYNLQYFAILDISNDEGDYAFWDEAYGEMDYDIDLDYFCERQKTLHSIFSENKIGLDKSAVKYGAARNG